MSTEAWGGRSKTAHLDNADIRRHARLVDGNLSDALDPVLNRVRNVRNDLNSLAEVVATPLEKQTVLVSPR